MSWRPLTRATAAETQQAIDTLLGLSRETYLASSHLSQGQGAAFTSAAPRDRKAVLSEILRLDLWERLLDLARTDIRQREDALQELRGRMSRAVELVAQKPANRQTTAALQTVARDTAGALADAEAELEKVHQETVANAAQVERARAAQTAYQAAADTHARLADLIDGAARSAEQEIALRDEVAGLARQAAYVHQLETDVSVLREQAAAAREARVERDQLLRTADERALARQRMAAEAERLHGQAVALESKAQHVLDHVGAATCDRCQQTLGIEAAEHASRSLRAEAADVRARSQQITAACAEDWQAIAEMRDRAAAIKVPETLADPAPVEAALAAARAAAARVSGVEALIGQHADKAAQLPQLRADAAAAAARVSDTQSDAERALAAVKDPAALDRQARTWQDAIRDHRTKLDQVQRSLAREQALAEQIAAAETQIGDASAARDRIHRELDILGLAEKAFGRDGIPALILEAAAIPQIELEANRILAELGTPYRVELRTQRALKTAAHLRETLDIVVSDGVAERDYSTFSGGERTRIDLALRLALAELLANRRGADTRILVIDEPDGLDAAGMDRLAAILDALQGTFERIMVVSHNPTLATAFEQTVEVVNDNGRSRIVGDRVEVAA